MHTLLMLLALAARARTPRGVAAQPVSSASAIKLDGELSEEVWQKAPVVTGFRQREPNDGAAATFETEARVAYDANALYIAVQAIDPEPARIVGIRTRRDESIAVGLDSRDDRLVPRPPQRLRVRRQSRRASSRTRYWFNDTNNDQGWDAVWDVAGQPQRSRLARGVPRFRSPSCAFQRRRVDDVRAGHRARRSAG